MKSSKLVCCCVRPAALTTVNRGTKRKKGRAASTLFSVHVTNFSGIVSVFVYVLEGNCCKCIINEQFCASIHFFAVNSPLRFLIPSQICSTTAAWNVCCLSPAVQLKVNILYKLQWKLNVRSLRQKCGNKTQGVVNHLEISSPLLKVPGSLVMHSYAAIDVIGFWLY